VRRASHLALVSPAAGMLVGRIGLSDGLVLGRDDGTRSLKAAQCPQAASLTSWRSSWYGRRVGCTEIRGVNKVDDISPIRSMAEYRPVERYSLLARNLPTHSWARSSSVPFGEEGIEQDNAWIEVVVEVINQILDYKRLSGSPVIS
jgi:hypothetical protein